MNIIESWVDESQVRDLAQQLIAPHHSQISSESDEDFIVADPEEIFVAQSIQQATTGDPVLDAERQNIDQVVQALAENVPVISEEKAVHESARKALAAASMQASQSGVIGSRLANVEGLDEERGWNEHGNVSSELMQHLGESAGALLNREAVQDGLASLTQYLSDQWNGEQITISDRDGDIFVDTMQNSAWSRLTVSVTEPIRLLDIKQGAIGHGYMHLKVSALEYLQVVVTSTSHGLIIVGMLRAKPLRSVQVKELVDKVREII